MRFALIITENGISVIIIIIMYRYERFIKIHVEQVEVEKGVNEERAKCTSKKESRKSSGLRFNFDTYNCIHKSAYIQSKLGF